MQFPLPSTAAIGVTLDVTFAGLSSVTLGALSLRGRKVSKGDKVEEVEGARDGPGQVYSAAYGARRSSRRLNTAG